MNARTHDDEPERRLAPFDGAPVTHVGATGFPLDEHALGALVRAALDEDAAFHDVSTLATVRSDRRVRAVLVARVDGVLAGVPLACEAFRLLDARTAIRVEHADGEPVRAGDVVLRLHGQARALLSAERVALNYLQRLSGVAALTAL